MRFKFIGCASFRHDAEALAPDSGHEIIFDWLPQGLHAAPEILRTELQKAIDRVALMDGFDVLLIGYGLCGHGIAGV